MRSRLFAIIMAVASVAALFVALPILNQLQTRRSQRDRYAEAFELAKTTPAQALVTIEDCLEFRPEDKELRKLGAGLALRVGDAVLAEKHFAPLLETEEPPFPAQAHLSLGAMYFSGGSKTEADPGKAVEHFKASLKLDKSQTLALAGIAFAYTAQNKLKEATPYLRRIAGLPHSTAFSQYISAARLWLFSEMFQSGDPLACWVSFQSVSLPPSVKGKYERPLKAAVAAKVDTPGISSAVRRVCIGALRTLLKDKQTTSEQKVVLNTLLAHASDRIGDEREALASYKAAYKADSANDTAALNLAHALVQVSDTKRYPKEGEANFNMAVGIYKQILEAGKLDDAARLQITIALATFAWNDGRREEAMAMFAHAKDMKAPEIERMNAAKAIEAGDYEKAIAHLGAALKLAPTQRDIQKILEGFKRPPLIDDLKANRSSDFDARPILSATIVPRSVPKPVDAGSVEMRLDGGPIADAIVTRSGVFYQPRMDLPAGKHTLVVSATDALGLKGSGTLEFEVAKDSKPPSIIALTPSADKETGTLEPIIAFRCTDPSGINEASLKVTFDGKLKKSNPTTRMTIIDRGAYRIAFGRANIKRGQRVPYGAGYFRFSEPLLEGEKYTVRVGVSDVRSNRALREWTFTATRGPDDAPE